MVELPNGIVVPREQTYVTPEGRFFFLQELPRMRSAEQEGDEKEGGAAMPRPGSLAEGSKAAAAEEEA